MLTGGCQCGRVRYAAEGVPFNETACHCGQCRRSTGAPFAAWFTVKRDAMRWLGEAPRRYASSPRAERGFCPHCGSSLTYEGRVHPDDIDLAMASLDVPDALAVKDHLYVADKLPWVRLADGLPQYAGEREAG